jgi:hypothetical protein
MYRLYREPAFEEEIVLAADPADGGSDFCAAVAKSRKHHDTVMNFHGHAESGQFGHELHRMAKYIYNRTNIWPLIAVERNTGMATIYVLQELNYPRLFRMPTNLAETDRVEEKKIGWVTNTGTRPKMLDDLALSIRQRTNIIPDEETVLELISFIRNPRNGKPEAMPGKHDDLVISEAIAEQMLQFSPASSPTDWKRITSQFPQDDGLPDYV